MRYLCCTAFGIVRASHCTAGAAVPVMPWAASIARAKRMGLILL